MELDWSTSQANAVTLVRVTLRNERETDRSVRLENRLAGPVLPPRRQGEPEPGWDRDGVCTQVPAGETVALGYACPAAATDPPVAINAVESADESVTDEAVSKAVRKLGDARPPRAVLTAPPEPAQEGPTEPSRSTATASAESETRSAVASKRPLPSDAEAVLQPYRERLETVEALGVASVSEAAALLETNGGLAGVETMNAELATDASALRALAAEATALAARAETATIPTNALRRLS